MKIIPTIDLMDGQVVRLYKEIQNKKLYTVMILCLSLKNEDAGADMLHVVDLDATIGTGSNLDLIEKILRNYPFL